MALLLNVPYAEKDNAKALGAKWNPDLKKWFVKNQDNYFKFSKWFPSNSSIIICDYVYIVEGKRKCFRCQGNTRVIGFGIENYYEFGDIDYPENDFLYHKGTIRILSRFSPMPTQLLDYVHQTYNYNNNYSKTTQCSYWSNNCDACNSLQGDWYLFSEPDSPFYIADKSDALNLTLYKIPLAYDIAINDFGGNSLFAGDLLMSDEFGFNNHSLIKKYSKILPLDIITDFTSFSTIEC